MLNFIGEENPDALPTGTVTKGLRVVGLGVSAGGLDALKGFFGRMITDSGMAFVVIQHLDPEHPSLLQSLLATSTGMPVVEATSGMLAEGNHVYLIPSDCDLQIQGGIFILLPRQLTGRLHLPIDTFFRSAAEDCHERAIGVVLSGSGADGTEGLRAIKAGGGVTFAQQPDSAQFPSMPESAIAASVVDFCGTSIEIADELARLHACSSDEVQSRSARPLAVEDSDLVLDGVIDVLRQHAGLDLNSYKRSTAMRRIERRMGLRHTLTMEEYLGTLRDDPDEAKALA
ncbi:MAG TPA: chemotaxis protein CheB, partial [Polyangiaceae bacterium]